MNTPLAGTTIVFSLALTCTFATSGCAPTLSSTMPTANLLSESSVEFEVDETEQLVRCRITFVKSYVELEGQDRFSCSVGKEQVAMSEFSSSSWSFFSDPFTTFQGVLPLRESQTYLIRLSRDGAAGRSSRDFLTNLPHAIELLPLAKDGKDVCFLTKSGKTRMNLGREDTAIIFDDIDNCNVPSTPLKASYHCNFDGRLCVPIEWLDATESYRPRGAGGLTVWSSPKGCQVKNGYRSNRV